MRLDIIIKHAQHRHPPERVKHHARPDVHARRKVPPPVIQEIPPSHGAVRGVQVAVVAKAQHEEEPPLRGLVFNDKEDEDEEHGDDQQQVGDLQRHGEGLGREAGGRLLDRVVGRLAGEEGEGVADRGEPACDSGFFLSGLVLPL